MADALDELYEVKPEEFTALRTKLAAAAKKRGDADTAKQISAARKPTTAAWVVNRLAIREPQTSARLGTLGEQLKEAHTAMDGDRIRELSRQQRRLVDDLAREAFEEAELVDPSAALRDDVVGTLQAAIADPDVASRLGRLTKAEQWSGFGEFGDTTMVFTATRKPARAKPAEPDKKGDDKKGDDEEGDDKKGDDKSRAREEARAALTAAEHAKAEADAALGELQSDLATARLRRDDARRRLKDAEEALAAAEDAYDKGKQASREAAEQVKAAKAELR